MKQCCTCKQLKPPTEFYKSSSSNDGIQRQCKLCKKKFEKPDLIVERSKRYRKNNTDKCKAIEKAWRKKNPNYSIEYYHTHKEPWLKRTADYRRTKYQNDPSYRIQQVLSTQIWYYLSGKGKENRTVNLLGYTIEDFIRVCGVGEENQQIDHKIPITWFIDNTPIHIMWHLDNLQWLDSKQNKRKGNRYADPVLDSYLQIALPHIKENFVNFLKH